METKESRNVFYVLIYCHKDGLKATRDELKLRIKNASVRTIFCAEKDAALMLSIHGTNLLDMNKLVCDVILSMPGVEYTKTYPGTIISSKRMEYITGSAYVCYQFVRNQYGNPLNIKISEALEQIKQVREVASLPDGGVIVFEIDTEDFSRTINLSQEIDGILNKHNFTTTRKCSCP